jgi:hypothetical protein
MQHGRIKLPLADWKIDSGTVVEAHDLLSDETYLWRDEWTYVRLDPQTRVAHIIAVRPAPIVKLQSPIAKADV